MALQRITIKGFGQVELNNVTFRRNGSIEAQCRLSEDFATVPAENGMILSVNKGKGEVGLPTPQSLVFALNYSAEHLYDQRDKSLKSFRLTPGEVYPRLGYLVDGDRFTTNCLVFDTEEFEDETEALKKAVYGGISSVGAILISKEAPTEGPVLLVVKVMDMPDGQVGIKFQVTGYVTPEFTPLPEEPELPVEIEIISAVQDGGVSETTDSTSIVITFDEDVVGLEDSHITLANGTGSATKGTLTGTGKVWTLTITDPTEGDVTILISGLDGYKFPETATVVAIYSEEPELPVGIVSAVQDGGVSGVTDSTSIVITFDEDVVGLEDSHIALADDTGSAVKGALTGAGKIWTLAITDPTEGDVTILISGLDGYKFPETATVVAIYSEEP